jgi:hypothetical protein
MMEVFSFTANQFPIGGSNSTESLRLSRIHAVGIGFSSEATMEEGGQW